MSLFADMRLNDLKISLYFTGQKNNVAGEKL